jgi:SAM-dependent methyltransferase
MRSAGIRCDKRRQQGCALTNAKTKIRSAMRPANDHLGRSSTGRGLWLLPGTQKNQIMVFVRAAIWGIFGSESVSIRGVMDTATYAAEAVLEENHWWYVGRRALFSDTIKTFGLPENADILDVGTSAGTSLRMLRELGFSRVHGVDQSPDAIRFCAEKGLGKVDLGDICALPFDNRRFDLVLATDIIEHVEDDLLALRELHRVLKPGGYLLLTVPTFPILWGLEDEVSHHKRRYRLPELLEKLNQTNLVPTQYFYFNYLLFLPILVTRLLMRMINVKVATEGEINTAWTNRVLAPLFRFDVMTASRVRPLVGVSALAVATRK